MKILLFLSLLFLSSITSAQSYTFCSNEFTRCNFTGTKVVRFGNEGKYVFGTYTNGVECDFRVLGDPLPYKTKVCEIQVASNAVISSLTATSTNIAYNGSVTLNFATSNATSLVLNPGNINVLGQSSYTLSNLTQSATYTLTANPGNISKTISINVASAPVTSEFIFCSNEFTRCNFTGTKVVRFGNEGKYVFGTYTNGVECDFRVLGDPLPYKTKVCEIQSTSVSNAAISSLTASSTNIAYNGSATLNFAVSNATSLILNPGNINVLGKSSYTFNNLTQSGTYTLTANPGNISKTISISVASAPVTSGFVFCANEGERCNFSGTKLVRFGTEGIYVTGTYTDGVNCGISVFGDPTPNKVKTCEIADSDTPVVVDPTPPGANATRPSYNKGTGFFVIGSKLFDANGNEFRIRGINKLHYDFAAPGLAKTKANAARWNLNYSSPSNIDLLKGGSTQAVAGTNYDKMVVIPGVWSGPWGDATCNDDPNVLQGVVDMWVSQVNEWKKLERYSIINIANEWGPGNSAVWRDSYITAVKRMRDAGYTHTLQITSGGCGQNADNLIKYAKAVFDSDPQKNIIFDLHIYGTFKDEAGGGYQLWNGQVDLPSQLTAMKNTGLAFVIGEFGPDNINSPSKTTVKPLRIMQLAEQNAMGWMAWAWDDGVDGTDNWFAMTRNGYYDSSSDLTNFGKTVVEDPQLGLKVLAKPASVFGN